MGYSPNSGPPTIKNVRRPEGRNIFPTSERRNHQRKAPLHSNMFLLIQDKSILWSDLLHFTFQYVSINTAGYKGAFIRKINFTFQYVSINTQTGEMVLYCE